MIWIGLNGRAAARRPNVLRRFPVVAFAALALGLATQTAVAQTLQQQQAPGAILQHPPAAPNVTRQPGQGAAPPQQRPEAAPTAPPAGGDESVDTTGVWYHLRQHDLNSAETEFKRLSQSHPRWQPPADLMFALRTAEFDAAKARHDTEEMRRLATSVGSFDRCGHPDLAWGIVEVPGIGDRQTLLDMARCADAGVAAGSMDRYLRGVAPANRMTTVTSLAQQQWPQSVRKVLDGAKLQASLDALATGHPTDAELADAEAMTTAAQNSGAAITLGWHYFKAGNAAKAKQWFSSALAWGGDSSAHEGLARSQLAEGDLDAVKRMIQSIPALRAPLADALLNRALTRVDQGASIDEIASDVKDAIEFGKSDAWETVGWRLLDHHRPDDALAAFTQAGEGENAVFGRIMAMRAAGQVAAADALACKRRSLSDRLTKACADSIAGRQLAAYKAGDYAEAEKLGDQLAAIAPDRLDARALTAWSAYHANNPQKAARIFAELYARKHDHDLANGLALSMRSAGQTEQLRALAASDKMLADVVAAQDADTGWYRKQFDLAATGPSPKEGLAGRPGWLVGAGMETAFITADQQPGQGLFKALAGQVFAQGMVGQTRLGFSVTGAGIDIGTPAPDALIGLRPLADQFPPTTGASLIQPAMTARWEAPDWTTSAMLGLTPLNGAVSPLPIGNVSVTHYMDPVILTGGFFARSVTNSLLSYAGMIDPVSGAAWGRVTDMGASFRTIYLPLDRVSLTFTGEGAYLAGDNVASNNRVSLRFDASYDFRPDNFDHLRFGPFLSFAHYERNLDFYTFGQGGYYSPDADTRGGVLLDLLTPEGRKWQIEFKQSVAYGKVSEAASPEFPLSSSMPTFAGTKLSGIDLDSQLRGSVLLSDHLILSGFAGYSNAPGYNGIVAGASLSIPFDMRRGVFSTDFPDSTFRPFDVWR
jgi:cellulose synthase operon protein C